MRETKKSNILFANTQHNNNITLYAIHITDKDVWVKMIKSALLNCKSCITLTKQTLLILLLPKILVGPVM